MDGCLSVAVTHVDCSAECRGLYSVFKFDFLKFEIQIQIRSESFQILQLMDRIEGRNGLQLPWEGDMSPKVRRKLGIFRATVLKLLERDPAKRPSMKEFCASCDRVLAGSTSVQL